MKAQNKPTPTQSVGFLLTLEHRFANTKSSQLLKDNSPWYLTFLTFEQEERTIQTTISKMYSKQPQKTERGLPGG